MAGIPLVTTLHGTDVRMVRNISMSRPAFRHVMKHSAAVTAVSRWLADEAQSIVSIAPPIVAPMPVATELFTPDASVERQRRLLFVGRLMAQKGIELLIDALAELPADVALDVIGGGPDRSVLEARAAALGVAERVTWHGAVKQFELPQFYRKAAALVLPSELEGLGLVAVEAQLCETPVVAFASGGIVDVIQHERTGLLVPERTAGALAAALRDLLSSSDRGATMGAASRLTALATFAPESVARRYAEVYASVIAARPA
jgi:glycosyltransferase involved in cell wall biosynthesis